MHIFDFDGPGKRNALAKSQLEAWKNAPDLETLFALNESYIRGKLVVHPAHPTSLYGESKKLRQNLLAMNEFGMWTFQGQPRKWVADAIPPHTHKDDITSSGEMVEYAEKESGAACRCCCADDCYGHPELHTQVRTLPYVQFCLPVEGQGTVTLTQATEFARALLNDKRLHTMISWPRDLEIPEENMERDVSMPWRQADLTEAAKYIPQSDLNMYAHFKSKHGSSCAHEITRDASFWKLGGKSSVWKPAKESWSEVNDYHLLRPRTPKFFLGLESKTIVFGVNVTNWAFEVKDIESVILEAAQACDMPRCFPDKVSEKSPRKSLYKRLTGSSGSATE